MRDVCDPGLADFTSDELRQEIWIRSEQKTRAFLDSVGPCPECGGPIQFYSTKVIKTFRSGGWRSEITRACVNHHETVTEEVRSKAEAERRLLGFRWP